MKRLIAITISLMYFCFSLQGRAEGTSTSTSGKFTIIQKGMKVPFDGVLFDPLATATILTDKDQKEQECKIEKEYSLGKQKADLELDIKNLKSSLEYNKKTNEEIVAAKDKELDRVRDIAAGKTDYAWLYASGGVLVGTAITLLAIFVVRNVQQ